jgi:hypothetical protein
MRQPIARGARPVLVSPIESPELGPFSGHRSLLGSGVSRLP